MADRLQLFPVERPQVFGGQVDRPPVFVDEVQVAAVVVAPLAGRCGSTVRTRRVDACPPVSDRVFERLQSLEPASLNGTEVA
jgi:hypothetical protein